MSTKAPLVMGSNGLPQQLQAGDQLAAGIATYDSRVYTNGEASASLVAGMAVYTSASGSMKRAQANALTTADPAAIVVDATIAAAATGNFACGGVLTLTTAEWDAVTGQTGGLTPGARYFVSPTTAGQITSTPPSTVGQVVALVGRATSTTDLEIELGTPILL
jgi:hypothetical protein